MAVGDNWWRGEGWQMPFPSPDQMPSVSSLGSPTCYHHKVDQFTVYDDVVAGNCINCNDRVELSTYPGGILAIRTRHLLEQFITEGEASPDTLEKLFQLKELLALEMEELGVVSDRIEVIQASIRERLEE